MNVLLITQHFRPEPNFITADVADGLLGRGHRVTVVTAHPNYPLGRYYDSVISWWPDRERKELLTVWRLPLYTDHSQSKIKRVFHYLSFTLLAMLWAPLACPSPDVVIVYQTPFSVGLAALWFRWFRRSKVYFISADLWPESFPAAGIRLPSLLERGMYAYSRWINRRADVINTTTRGMHARYRKDRVLEEKLVFIPLWVDGSEGPADDSALPHGESIRCVYLGNVGAAQGLDTVIRAAELLAVEHPKVEFEIIGTGVEKDRLQELASGLGLANVSFFDRVSPEKAFKIAQSASIQLIHLLPSPLFSMVIPSKLAFSLAAGTPIVGGVLGESARILHESGNAEAVAPQDHRAMAAAILRLALRPIEQQREGRRKSRAYFEQHFAPSTLLSRHVTAIETLATSVGRQRC